jgi:hypothetical protein
MSLPITGEKAEGLQFVCPPNEWFIRYVIVSERSEWRLKKSTHITQIICVKYV